MVEPGRVSSAESTAVDGCEGSAVDPFKVAASESASFTSASEQTAGCNDNNDSNNKHQPTLLEKPTRPLSAYNLFFRDQRERLLQGLTAQERPSSSKTSRGKKQPHHKIGFSNLAKTIASRWRIIDNDLKAQYEAIANEERRNYIKRVQAWRDHRKALGLSTKMGKKKMKTQARATQPKVVAVADVVNYPTDDYLLANHHVPHIGPSTDNGQATWGQPNHFYPVQRPYHHTEEEAYDPC